MAAIGRFVNELEETLIALLLGLMTIVTFANVVARYGFNSNILWALEITVFMFGWLVLLGASYAVKTHIHLGVDALINAVSPSTRYVLGLISVTCCIVYAFLLFKGSWDYWANFANLPATEGRWFPLGFEQEFRPKGWYEVNDTPMPEWLRWMEDAFNDGDEYEKIPRMIPYVVLPLAMGLLLFRFLQAGWQLLHGHKDRLVASHEVEDELEALQEERN
ncbi:C4-dicarboxylate transporter DctQ subunit [Aliiruegeria haliotis]|uniref:TRAP transporter small permease protein n=1 Tax=Aliiruegeria haliotis TaxID=1280846 RepID=A0A2T0RZ07_9RHOB|nr:TRAP transporter small permease [Aliiruegeria haliotis]PRY26372.1 C4-dicarboxylate transporter DctQ subunit [Aliiruegeria haliotis]